MQKQNSNNSGMSSSSISQLKSDEILHMLENFDEEPGRVEQPAKSSSHSVGLKLILLGLASTSIQGVNAHEHVYESLNSFHGLASPEVNDIGLTKVDSQVLFHTQANPQRLFNLCKEHVAFNMDHQLLLKNSASPLFNGRRSCSQKLVCSSTGVNGKFTCHDESFLEETIEGQQTSIPCRWIDGLPPSTIETSLRFVASDSELDSYRSFALSVPAYPQMKQEDGALAYELQMNGSNLQTRRPFIGRRNYAYKNDMNDDAGEDDADDASVDAASAPDSYSNDVNAASLSEPETDDYTDASDSLSAASADTYSADTGIKSQSVRPTYQPTVDSASVRAQAAQPAGDHYYSNQDSASVGAASAPAGRNTNQRYQTQGVSSQSAPLSNSKPYQYDSNTSIKSQSTAANPVEYETSDSVGSASVEGNSRPHTFSLGINLGKGLGLGLFDRKARRQYDGDKGYDAQDESQTTMDGDYDGEGNDGEQISKKGHDRKPHGFGMGLGVGAQAQAAIVKRHYRRHEYEEAEEATSEDMEAADEYDQPDDSADEPGKAPHQHRPHGMAIGVGVGVGVQGGVMRRENYDNDMSNYQDTDGEEMGDDYMDGSDDVYDSNQASKPHRRPKGFQMGLGVGVQAVGAVVRRQEDLGDSEAFQGEDSGSAMPETEGAEDSGSASPPKSMARPAAPPTGSLALGTAVGVGAKGGLLRREEESAEDASEESSEGASMQGNGAPGAPPHPPALGLGVGLGVGVQAGVVRRQSEEAEDEAGEQDEMSGMQQSAGQSSMGQKPPAAMGLGLGVGVQAGVKAGVMRRNDEYYQESAASEDTYDDEYVEQPPSYDEVADSQADYDESDMQSSPAMGHQRRPKGFKLGLGVGLGVEGKAVGMKRRQRRRMPMEESEVDDEAAGQMANYDDDADEASTPAPQQGSAPKAPKAMGAGLGLGVGAQLAGGVMRRNDNETMDGQEDSDDNLDEGDLQENSRAPATNGTQVGQQPSQRPSGPGANAGRSYGKMLPRRFVQRNANAPRSEAFQKRQDMSSDYESNSPYSQTASTPSDSDYAAGSPSSPDYDGGYSTETYASDYNSGEVAHESDQSSYYQSTSSQTSQPNLLSLGLAPVTGILKRSEGHSLQARKGGKENTSSKELKKLLSHNLKGLQKHPDRALESSSYPELASQANAQQAMTEDDADYADYDGTLEDLEDSEGVDYAQDYAEDDAEDLVEEASENKHSGGGKKFLHGMEKAIEYGAETAQSMRGRRQLALGGLALETDVEAQATLPISITKRQQQAPAMGLGLGLGIGAQVGVQGIVKRQQPQPMPAMGLGLGVGLGAQIGVQGIAKRQQTAAPQLGLGLGLGVGAQIGVQGIAKRQQPAAPQLGLGLGLGVGAQIGVQGIAKRQQQAPAMGLGLGLGVGAQIGVQGIAKRQQPAAPQLGLGLGLGVGAEIGVEGLAKRQQQAPAMGLGLGLGIGAQVGVQGIVKRQQPQPMPAMGLGLGVGLGAQIGVQGIAKRQQPAAPQLGLGLGVGLGAQIGVQGIAKRQQPSGLLGGIGLGAQLGAQLEGIALRPRSKVSYEDSVSADSHTTMMEGAAVAAEGYDEPYRVVEPRDVNNDDIEEDDDEDDEDDEEETTSAAPMMPTPVAQDKISKNHTISGSKTMSGAPVSMTQTMTMTTQMMKRGMMTLTTLYQEATPTSEVLTGRRSQERQILPRQQMNAEQTQVPSNMNVAGSSLSRATSRLTGLLGLGNILGL